MRLPFSLWRMLREHPIVGPLVLLAAAYLWSVRDKILFDPVTDWIVELLGPRASAWWAVLMTNALAYAQALLIVGGAFTLGIWLAYRTIYPRPTLVRGRIPIATSDIMFSHAARHNASPSDPNGRIDLGFVQITNLSKTRPAILTLSLRSFTDTGVDFSLNALGGPYQPYYENPVRIPPSDYARKRLAFLMDEHIWPTYVTSSVKGALKHELIIEDAISGGQTIMALPGKYRGLHA